MDFGSVTVGDEKTLRVVGEDAAGNDLVDVGAEVVVSPPSGEETTYTNADMKSSSDGEELFLDLLFDEAGYWHVQIQVQKGGGQEVDSGWVRARANEPRDLSILTRGAWHRYLSEEAMAEGPDSLYRMISDGEHTVVNRYREHDNRDAEDLILDEYYDRDVRLDGWIETDGDPDLDRMDEDLLDALRESISRYVQHHVDKPDEAEHVARLDQGERRADFRDKGVPYSVFAPLRPFDERRRFHF